MTREDITLKSDSQSDYYSLIASLAELNKLELLKEIYNCCSVSQNCQKSLSAFLQYSGRKEAADDLHEYIGESPEIRFLLIYGFLQSLYVLQDNLYYLFKNIVGENCEINASKFIENKCPNSNRIRSIRNNVIGHPVYNHSRIPTSLITDFISLETIHYFESGEIKQVKSEELVQNTIDEFEPILGQIILKLNGKK